MKFPYFGHNWDALWDLFNDFHWIKEEHIYLIHLDIPLIENIEDLKIYIEILNDAVEAWESRKEHKLFVLFPEKYRKPLENILKS